MGQIITTYPRNTRFSIPVNVSYKVCSSYSSDKKPISYDVTTFRPIPIDSSVNVSQTINTVSLTYYVSSDELLKKTMKLSILSGFHSHLVDFQENESCGLFGAIMYEDNKCCENEEKPVAVKCLQALEYAFNIS